MKTSAFRNYVEEQINIEARRIVEKGTATDEIALGRLDVLLGFRRTLDNKSTPEDIGRWGAINDALQQLGVLDGDETLFSGLEAER